MNQSRLLCKHNLLYACNPFVVAPQSQIEQDFQSRPKPHAPDTGKAKPDDQAPKSCGIQIDLRSS
jgi:hypothetical protein